jgi:hypothetical protein
MKALFDVFITTQNPLGPGIRPDRSSGKSSFYDRGCRRAIVLTENTTNIKSQRILACGISLSNIVVINKIARAPEVNTETPVLSQLLNHLGPFYCIFASSSTGRPKGILNYGQLRYEMEGYNRYIGPVLDDRILLASAVVFDMSLPTIYGTIQYGATVFVVSSEGNLHPGPCVTSRETQMLTERIFSPVFTSQDGRSVVDHKISSYIITPIKGKCSLLHPTRVDCSNGLICTHSFSVESRFRHGLYATSID